MFAGTHTDDWTQVDLRIIRRPNLKKEPCKHESRENNKKWKGMFYLMMWFQKCFKTVPRRLHDINSLKPMADKDALMPASEMPGLSFRVVWQPSPLVTCLQVASSLAFRSSNMNICCALYAGGKLKLRQMS